MRRVRMTLAVIAVLAGIAGTGVATHSALSSTTVVPGNNLTTGTVDLADNDADQALVSLTDAEPGATDTSCIRVSYAGTLDASVRLYATVTGALGPYVDVVITRGTDPTPAFGDCTDFMADDTDYLGAGAGVIYDGTLAGLPATWDTALVDPATWTGGDAHVFKVSVTLQNDSAARGLTADASFTWESRNA